MRNVQDTTVVFAEGEDRCEVTLGVLAVYVLRRLAIEDARSPVKDGRVERAECLVGRICLLQRLANVDQERMLLGIDDSIHVVDPSADHSELVEQARCVV